LSPRERINIFENYGPSNMQVARVFFGRSDGKLFYAPELNTNEAWHPVIINDSDFVARIFSLFLEQKAIGIEEEFTILKTFKMNAWKTFEDQGKVINQQREAIKQQSKECHRLQNLLFGQTLTIFKRSRLSYFKCVKRFLRVPLLNEVDLLMLCFNFFAFFVTACNS